MDNTKVSQGSGEGLPGVDGMGDIKIFKAHQVAEAVAHAARGGRAVHLHRVCGPGAPTCFRRNVKAGKDIAHLFDQDVDRLVATVKRIGVRVVVVERRGTDRQHVDLCGSPLGRLLAWADSPGNKGKEQRTMDNTKGSPRQLCELHCADFPPPPVRIGGMITLEVAGTRGAVALNPAYLEQAQSEEIRKEQEVTFEVCGEFARARTKDHSALFKHAVLAPLVVLEKGLVNPVWAMGLRGVLHVVCLYDGVDLVGLAAEHISGRKVL